MKRVLLSITAIIILSAMLVGCGHTHEWAPATCESPKTCTSCGETEGEPLGHEWVEATCQEPKHCVRCDAVQGDVTEHSWQDATCTEPKTCTACGEIEGEPLGHSVREWTVTKEPTCSEEGQREGICTRCSETITEDIEKLPHTAGEWQIVTDYMFNSDGTVHPGKESIVCTVCGEEMETREYTTELTLSQKNAVISAYDEISFWHCGASYLINTILVDFNQFPLEDAKLAVSHMDIDWDEQAVLFAQKNCSGASKDGLTREMRYNGFTSDQITLALEAVGY